MTLKEQRDIIQAAIDGKKVLQQSTSKIWMTVYPDHEFDFSMYDYKIEEPKKNRLIRVDELPACCHVGAPSRLKFLVTCRDEVKNEIFICMYETWFTMKACKDRGFKWSGDLKTWNSFEVEE